MRPLRKARYTPEQLTRLINAAGWDAGNRAAAAAGRKRWTRADYNAAAREANRLFKAVGLTERRTADNQPETRK